MLDLTWDLEGRPRWGTLLSPDRPRNRFNLRRGRSAGGPSCWRRLHT